MRGSRNKNYKKRDTDAYKKWDTYAADVVASRLDFYHRNGVGLLTMDPEAINASMGRASMVGCEVKPNGVNNARAHRFKDVESLSVALLEIIRKLC